MSGTVSEIYNSDPPEPIGDVVVGTPFTQTTTFDSSPGWSQRQQLGFWEYGWNNDYPQIYECTLVIGDTICTTPDRSQDNATLGRRNVYNNCDGWWNEEPEYWDGYSSTAYLDWTSGPYLEPYRSELYLWNRVPDRDSVYLDVVTSTDVWRVPPDPNDFLYRGIWLDVRADPAYSGAQFTLNIDSFVRILNGDMNDDGAVNGLDVNPFVEALLAGSTDYRGDMNDDGMINGLDVDPFVAAVLSGGAATYAIPEPSAIALLFIGLLFLGRKPCLTHSS